ncbi:MAG: rhodanese-like domain-containing protein [Pseudomonadota bacterium]|nr:rhodanese-like domain-containing protein [Pseudomonadota bacterium]
MQEIVEFTNNNTWLVIGLIASAFAVIFNELKIRSRAISALSAVMAVRVINDGGVVIDVRDSKEFIKSHIIDAHNITEKQLSESDSVLNRFKKSIVLVCDHGGRSGEYAKKLRANGNERVFSIKGGLQAWEEENLPVTSGRKK